jgi:hypothetical protein
MSPYVLLHGPDVRRGMLDVVQVKLLPATIRSTKD